jgi:cytochrome c-type biogenesis protein CcmH/NrfF
MPDSSAAYETAARAILFDCGCHPQSVLECACSHAEEMREAIRAEAAAGKSAEAIIAGYVSRSGESILVVPKAEGFNLLAWLGPGAGLVVAILGVAALVRRWRREPPPQAVAPPPPDEADLARLRRAIDEQR